MQKILRNSLHPTILDIKVELMQAVRNQTSISYLLVEQVDFHNILWDSDQNPLVDIFQAEKEQERHILNAVIIREGKNGS